MKPDSAHAQIADDLYEDITNGVYKPGQPLPSLRQLAIRYQVSTTPVRKALAELRAEGLITSGYAGVAFVSLPKNP